MIGRTNTGGGGSGGTLVVTGVAGDSVTAAKDSKTYTRTFNSDGKAVFRGLATGTWALTMTDGEQSVTQNVTITADYALTMAYFAATINVTYPAGSTCSCTDGVMTLNAPDTTGTWTCVVPNTGTWTFTIADGDKTKTDSVSITADGQTVTLEMVYILHVWPNVNDLEFTKKLNDSTDTATIIIDKNNPAKITLKVQDKTAGYIAVCNYSTPVDLTNYSILTLKMSFSTGREGGAGVLTSGSGCANNVAAGYKRTSSGSATVDNTYDISALTGVYWVGFWGNSSSSAIATVFTVEEFSLQ